MALHDLGLVGFEEPFVKFRAHGTIVKDGSKMSKSRGNVVVPDQYIEQWGADTFRMYLMFLGPYQEGGDFRDAGISGIRRFLDKVWGLVQTGLDGSIDQTAEPLNRLLHRTIQKVTSDTESLNYNTAISAMMEYVNGIREAGGAASRGLVQPLVVMLAAYAPHFAEECWERMGGKGSVVDAEWPSFDPALTLAGTVEVVVQVNGKVRARLQLARGTTQEAAITAAKGDEAVRKFIEGKEIRKAIHVPDKLVSLVV
jgi:leucyl-tRNA synthetase